MFQGSAPRASPGNSSQRRLESGTRRSPTPRDGGDAAPRQSRDSELEASAPCPLHPVFSAGEAETAAQTAQDPGAPPFARLQTLRREGPHSSGSSLPLDTQSRAESPWPSPLVTVKEFFLSNNPVKAQPMPKMCPGALPDGCGGRGGRLQLLFSRGRGRKGSGWPEPAGSLRLCLPPPGWVGWRFCELPHHRPPAFQPGLPGDPIPPLARMMGVGIPEGR